MYTAGAARSSVTTFTLTTVGDGGSGAPSLGNPVLSGGTFSFALTASPGTTITIQTSPTLAAGSWTTLLTTNSGSGAFTFTDTPGTTVPARFYRALQ